MALTFDHAFTVNAPVDRVWAYLTDPYRVAAALPGAAITDKIDDQNYGGTLTVKVGPVAAKYKGSIRFESLDRALGKAELSGRGQDTGGRGGADMKMTSHVLEKAANLTEVRVSSVVNVTGMMAQFGRGLIADVSNQMFGRFSEALKAELERPAAESLAEAAAPSKETTSAPSSPFAQPSERGSNGKALPQSARAGANAADEASAADARVKNGNGARDNTVGSTTDPVASFPKPQTQAQRAPEPQPSTKETFTGPTQPSHSPPIDVLSTVTSGAVSRALRRPAVWFALVVVGWLIYRCQ